MYKFWIAYADVDGFRIDTVKHMSKGATRFFASAIHEFAQSIGKENFFLVGEITGGRKRAFETLEETGLNAALGIDDIPDKLEYMVKGYRNPTDYFSLFRNSMLIQKESHVWFRDKVVTMFDDHDQVRKGQNKARFCADKDASKVMLNALALNAMTLGIPCIYYGTEQCFDGSGHSDRYLREAIFGSDFGAFRSQGVHFFNEDNPVYQELALILEIRRNNKVLCRGRQYLRSISGDGQNFGFPEMIDNQIRSVIPWSRILSKKEMLLAINTDYDRPRTAWVTIDNELHNEGDLLTCIYSTDKEQKDRTVSVEARNGKSVNITVPAAGFVIETQQPLRLYFYGSQGVGKSRTASAIANHLKVPLLTADLAIALQLKLDFDTIVRLLFREAKLHNAIVYLSGMDEILSPNHYGEYQQLLAVLKGNKSLS